MKIKIQVSFLSSSGIGTGPVNKLKYDFIVCYFILFATLFYFTHHYFNVFDKVIGIIGKYAQFSDQSELSYSAQYV